MSTEKMPASAEAEHEMFPAGHNPYSQKDS